MRQINLNNENEKIRFRNEISGWLTDEHQAIPYRRDDSTGKGANYTIFFPVKWKGLFALSNLKRELRNEVDADKITIEYVDFVKE